MRLHSIRDLLGGPLYLIKGFASILETNDLRLRDLQKSILDLITDLNTPDTLSAYLNLMTSESPPLDILLSKLIALGSQGQCVQPSIEIEFPVTSGMFGGFFFLLTFSRFNFNCSFYRFFSNARW